MAHSENRVGGYRLGGGAMSGNGIDVSVSYQGHLPVGMTYTFPNDGWNIVLEQIGYVDNPHRTSRTIEYFWGNDLSGTEEGAGGVGGLIATRIDGEFTVPVYGGNGNIMMTASVFSELYYASGTYTVSSYGDFILARNGCVVEIVGTVDHLWWDDYDWHAGLSAFVPGFGNVEDADAQRLEDAGMAKSFRMESEWIQTMRGKITIRKFLRNKSPFSWDLPVRGNTGIYAKHKRPKTTASGTGLGGKQ